MKGAITASISTAVFACSSFAFGETLAIATWNIQWLHSKDDRGTIDRDDLDFEHLRRIPIELDADIIALQEVDGEVNAANVFDPSHYDFFFSSRDQRERTGFAVRRRDGLSVDQNQDLVALSLGGGLPRGTDITVNVASDEIRFLSVHLHEGCRPQETNSLEPESPEPDPPGFHCQILGQQLQILNGWMRERCESGEAYVVMGTFGRGLGAHIAVSTNSGVAEEAPCRANGDPNGNAETSFVFTETGPITSIVTDRFSTCREGRNPEFADDILMSLSDVGTLIDDTFNEIPVPTEITIETEDGTNGEETLSLSDHCPISVQISIGVSNQEEPP